MAKPLKQKSINFLAVLEGRQARSGPKPTTFIFPGVLLAVVCVGISVFAFFHIQVLDFEHQYAALSEYLNSPTTTSQFAEAQTLQSQADALQREADGMATPIENLLSYPDLLSTDYRELMALAGANITVSNASFNHAAGTLNLTCTTEYLPAIDTFVSQLRNAAFLSDVEYTGYTGSSSPLSTPTVRSGSTTSGTTTGNTSAGGQTTSSTSTSGQAASGQASTSSTGSRYQFSLTCTLRSPTGGNTPDSGQLTGGQ
ncbi:MAG: hypothetical protein LBU07_00170 [Coriobacteriales bacterium]|jgi:hypothetical protein|nr:hypothetical protein [Coriobacteriales bacterium]